MPTNSIPNLRATRLGTERARSANYASSTWTVCESIASLPFGDGQVTNPAPANGYPSGCYHDSTLHFTGKERDSETGLDNFGARYNSSSFGRFLSPDPDNVSGLMNQDDPQSWNGYAYVRNNPIRYVDLDGEDVWVCIEGQDRCHHYTDAQWRSLYDKQNGQQGISLPGGNFPNGEITCGGIKCGTARYFDPGLESPIFANLGIGVAIGFLMEAGGFNPPVGSNSRRETGPPAPGTPGGKPTFQDLLQGTVKDGSGQPTKNGGFAQATKDFESLEGKSQNLGRVQVKELPDGGKAVLRNFSKDGRPTLEYQPAGGGSKAEWIRYNP